MEKVRKTKYKITEKIRKFRKSNMNKSYICTGLMQKFVSFYYTKKKLNKNFIH